MYAPGFLVATHYRRRSTGETLGNVLLNYGTPLGPKRSTGRRHRRRKSGRPFLVSFVALAPTVINCQWRARRVARCANASCTECTGPFHSNAQKVVASPASGQVTRRAERAATAGW